MAKPKHNDATDTPQRDEAEEAILYGTKQYKAVTKHRPRPEQQHNNTTQQPQEEEEEEDKRREHRRRGESMRTATGSILNWIRR